jgi:predicted metal-dependent peptidase
MRINKKRAYAFFLGDNLRLPQILPFPGKKRDLTFFIVILIDTSGSMGTDDIKEALSGIKNIIESDRHCKVTVLEVDGAVQKEYNVLKVGDIDFKISGRGGTTLGPGLFRAKELECDVCLGFTDAMTEVINDYSRKALPKKLIWVVPKENDVKTLNKTGPIVRI